MSKEVISCFVQSKMPNGGVMTGTAKVLWAVTLLLLHKADDQIFLTLFLYSLTTRSLFRGPLYPTDSSCPRYLYSSLSLSSLTFNPLISIDPFPLFRFPRIINTYAHLSSLNFIPISLDYVVIMSRRSFIMFIDSANNFRSSTKNAWFICFDVFFILYPSTFSSRKDEEAGFTECAKSITLSASP